VTGALAAAPRTLPGVAYPRTGREAGDVARAVAALRTWQLLLCYQHTTYGWVAWYRTADGQRCVPLDRAATWL
jgi:hypothetical protein